MVQYQSTPDYYRDYIEHGWLKDAAAKAHKYIDRWRGKNGKWYYSYKSKAQEQIANARRYINGFDADEISDFKKGLTSRSQKREARKVWIDKGRGKAYKTRKSQIRQARQNAYEAASRNPKIAYKTRTSQVKQARQNVIDAKNKHIEDVKKSYSDRKAYIRDSKGRTRHNNALKKLGYVYYKGKKLYK